MFLQFYAILPNIPSLLQSENTSMFDDFREGINYGNLSAQFHVGGSRHIDMVRFVIFFLNFLLEQLFKFVFQIYQDDVQPSNLSLNIDILG